MIKRLPNTLALTSLLACMCLVTFPGCGVGHGDTVTQGNQKEKAAHQKRAMEDPQGSVGLGRPDE